MKRLLMVFLMIFLMVPVMTGTAVAADNELCFSWLLNTDDITVGYEVYEDSRTNVFIPNIPLKSTYSDAPAGRHKVCGVRKDDKPHNYFVVAKDKDGKLSNNSDVVAFYPTDPDPDPIGPLPQSPGSVVLIIPADEKVSVNVEIDPNKSE